MILAQAVLIFGLFLQRARKRKTEAVLRESEKRFRVMADTTPSVIWMADQDGKITYLNSKSVEFTVDPRVGFGDSWSEYVHPDDLDSVLSANAAIDITDQKVAHDALENVNGRLIEAQEKERSRIVRDLHDDICQRLALLSMELEEANRTLDHTSKVATERLEQIRQHCAEIADDVQALSHELHSSKLDYQGIAAGIRGFCKEFAKTTQGQC